MTNLLTRPVLDTRPDGPATLPGVLSRLVRDEIDALPALRPHQAPAWHMFLVQLAALALHRAGSTDAPETEEQWLSLLRGLTPDFPDDEPWRLVVEDESKPAFLQPPLPLGAKVENPVSTADSLDLLITARNHDFKQAIAQHGEAQDWIFALVSLQTSEGYGGAGNHGIVRMNGGSSSRPMLGLAPLPSGSKSISPRQGQWFVRDVRVLLQTRDAELERHAHLDFKASNGLGLTWLVPWPEGAQLRLRELDIWFIEVCRRIRLQERNGVLSARRGTSKATRIDAKHLNGALGDPWAPVHKVEGKSFTLGSGDFGYRTLTKLLLGEKDSQDWELPVLAQPSAAERGGSTMALVAAALARGNSKTEGFRSRVLPIGGKQAYALNVAKMRKELFQLAQEQMAEIAHFDAALRNGLALAAASGDREKVRTEQYEKTREARARFDATIDPLFFEHLWLRHDAQHIDQEAVAEERQSFAKALFTRAEAIFEAALPSIPCQSLFRPRAEARARTAFLGTVHKAFPELFVQPAREEIDGVSA